MELLHCLYHEFITACVACSMVVGCVLFIFVDVVYFRSCALINSPMTNIVQEVVSIIDCIPELERNAAVCRGYPLLQNLAVCGLRVAKVHQLIHELVDDDKVISDALLFQLLEVFREHLEEH